MRLFAARLRKEPDYVLPISNSEASWQKPLAEEIPSLDSGKDRCGKNQAKTCRLQSKNEARDKGGNCWLHPLLDWRLINSWQVREGRPLTLTSTQWGGRGVSTTSRNRIMVMIFVDFFRSYFYLLGFHDQRRREAGPLALWSSSGRMENWLRFPIAWKFSFLFCVFLGTDSSRKENYLGVGM